jgi:inosine/xanthosine triphosphate pyrophosphatase family protein
MDSTGDKANHAMTVLIATTYAIYQPTSESDSEYDSEVYMEAQGDQTLEKTTEELQREAEEKIARAARLAKEIDKRKGHIGMQDDSGTSKDEHLDGAPTRRRHPKFNS